MSNADDVQKKLSELGRRTAGTAEGLVVSQDWDNRFVEVDLGGTRQTMRWTGAAPWPGDTVRVISAGENAFCVLVEGAPNGQVVSVASSVATVLGDDGRTYDYVDMVGGLAGGTRVRLDHAGRCVIGVYAVEPAGSEFVVPPPPPAPTISAQWFNPIWSGNWRPGYAGAVVEISETRLGAYGYGTQIADTIPDGAALRVAQLHLVQNWDEVPGVASDMGLHGFNGLPGTFEDGHLSGSYAVGGGTQVLNILGDVGTALKVGSAFGVGFRSNGGASGWRQFAAAPASGRIYMEW